jgi:hypothetical protein
MHHNGGMRHGSSPSQERTRTGLENRLSMLPARSRPADAPVKAKALLYRLRFLGHRIEPYAAMAAF